MSTEPLLVRVRKRADRFIHHPATELGVVVLIVASVILLVAEIAHVDQPGSGGVLALLGDILTVVFSVELSIRFWVTRKKLRFFRRYWLDILAVAPVGRPLRFFRVLRLLRVLRAGQILNRRISVFRGSFGSTLSEGLLLASLTTVVVLASSMAMYMEEGLINPDFATFDDAFWFAMFSLVGAEPIGGMPTTNAGRWITLGVMLAGLTVFGLFIGTVSAATMARLAGGLEVHEMELDELDDHVLVCGWNRSAATMVRELFASGNERPVVIITEKPEPPEDLPRDGLRSELIYYHSGDYTRVEVLQEVSVERAGVAIVLTDSTAPRSDQDRDARTVLAALTIERMAPDIFTCAELTNRQNESLLRMAGVEEIVVGDWYAGVILGSISRNRGMVKVLDDILSAADGNAFHKIVLPQTLHGCTVGELHQLLKQEHGAILISIEDEHGVMQVNPDPATPVYGDSIALVISHGGIRL